MSGASNAEGKVRALEEAAGAPSTAAKELEELRRAEARVTQAEQERTEALRLATVLENKLVEAEKATLEAQRRASDAEDKAQALEDAAGSPATEQAQPPVLGDDASEREALIEELQAAISAQRATIAKRDRALADQAAQLDACRAQLASLGAVVA